MSVRRIVSVDVVLCLCFRFDLTCTQILLQDDSFVVIMQMPKKNEDAHVYGHEDFADSAFGGYSDEDSEVDDY